MKWLVPIDAKKKFLFLVPKKIKNTSACLGRFLREVKIVYKANLLAKSSDSSSLPQHLGLEPCLKKNPSIGVTDFFKDLFVYYI